MSVSSSYYLGLYEAAKAKIAKYESNKAILSSLLEPIQSSIDNVANVASYSEKIILGPDPIDDNLFINMKGSLENAQSAVEALITESNIRIEDLEKQAANYYNQYYAALAKEKEEKGTE